MILLLEVPVEGVWAREPLVSTEEEGVRMGGRAVASEQGGATSPP